MEEDIMNLVSKALPTLIALKHKPDFSSLQVTLKYIFTAIQLQDGSLCKHKSLRSLEKQLHIHTPDQHCMATFITQKT